MFRTTVKPSKDQKVFKRTASKIKAVNLPSKVYRGGFRF